jgi:CRISPR type III-A-associated protein Csm2
MSRQNMGQYRPAGTSPNPPLFDPSKPDRVLFDMLAEQQADRLPRIGPTQLRRFFGEIKDLYRRFQAGTAGMHEPKSRGDYYRNSIEPQFKMMRSKVSYASRAKAQGRVPEEFAKMLTDGIGKVEDDEQFCRFVMHLEAVVGFLYGQGKVDG